MSTLAIVGDTTHHVNAKGELCTHAALAAQLDLWARYFDRVLFCGVLAEGHPPPDFAPYGSRNIELVPVRPAGGSGIAAKLKVIWSCVGWVTTITRVLKVADAVHLRTPCNVTIPTILVARLLVRNRYAIFVGSWDPYPGEPLSYRIQRAFLQRLFGGVVHAYMSTTNTTRPHIRPAISPVLTAKGLDRLRPEVEKARSARPPLKSGRALRVVCVGRFSRNKNQIALIRALRILAERDVAVECRLIGNGPELAAVEREAAGIPAVAFEPHADRNEVFKAMQWADVNVLPSHREGYGKVLLEGMCVGAIPVASDTPVNRSTTEGRGWVFNSEAPDELAVLLAAVPRLSPEELLARQSACIAYARRHTLDVLDVEIRQIVRGIWEIAE